MTDHQQPNDNQLENGGTPNPRDFRVPRSVGGYFADSTAYVNADTYTVVLPIAGALLVRLRGKMTGAGVLSFVYRRPPPYAAQAYSTAVSAPHADVNVSANTEFGADINPGGEPLLAVKWDPSADGTVDFLDVMQQ